MSLLFLTPLKVNAMGAWTPDSLTNQVYWYRDQYVLSAGLVANWVELYVPPAIGTTISFSGTFPSIGMVNSKNMIEVPVGTFGSMTTPSNTQVIDPSSPFTISYVHKGPTLSLGTYYGLFTIAGPDAANSMTLFYTNLSLLPIFYLQIGNGTVTVQGNSGFTPDAWHYTILRYNGAGDFNNSSNWFLNVNNVDLTLTSFTTGGGGGAINTFGDGSGGGAPSPLDYAELILVQDFVTDGDFENLKTYYNNRYAI